MTILKGGHTKQFTRNVKKLYLESEHNSYKKIDELTFSDLCIDTTDQTFPEFQEVFSNVFKALRYSSKELIVSLHGKSFILYLKHKGLLWHHY